MSQHAPQPVVCFQHGGNAVMIGHTLGSDCRDQFVCDLAPMLHDTDGQPLVERVEQGRLYNGYRAQGARIWKVLP